MSSSSRATIPTRRVSSRRPGALLGLFLGLAALAGAARAAAPVEFNRDIRPLLSDHCYACHGPDEKVRKAGLRLDREADAKKALKSGRCAIVPEHPDQSSLVTRIKSADADEVMPPPAHKKPLTPAQRELLERWIAEGAHWERHWAYVKPERPAPPAVQEQAWARNDLDRFVLARLEREGLKPSPEAPPEKLLRRATLDLTGLPPTIEEVDALLADTAPGAYERVVDRLLASPQYGERMAQYWLDLARYGETQGYHHDRHRDLWTWRDWVIQAYNQNMPFDQFTIEQLAGDLLPNPTRDQLIATGFHRNEMTTSEGGALPEEYAVKYVVGRVDTTARVWLGTSMACAECHDHKYDPISQKDFYRFFAFFNQVPENGLDAEELNPVPRITLETPDQRNRLAELEREVNALDAAVDLALTATRPAWDQAQTEWDQRQRAAHVQGWGSLKLASASLAPGGQLQQRDDQSIGFDRTPPGTAYDLVFRTEATNITGLQLETLPDELLPARGAGLGTNGEFMLTGIEVRARALAPDVAAAATNDAPALSPWFAVGPFAAGSPQEAFDKAFGPENGVDLKATFQDGKLRWVEHADWADATVVPLTGENSAHYLHRTITVKSPRALQASLGSDDGIQVWLNGRRILANNAARAAAPDQEKARLWLRPGENRLLLKINNGGGPGGFYFRLDPQPLLEVPVTFAAAAADASAQGAAIAGVLDDDPNTGWSTPAPATTPHRAWLQAQEAFGFPGGTELQVRLRFDAKSNRAALGRFRVAASTSPTLPDFLQLAEPLRNLLLVAPDQRSEPQRAEFRKLYRQQFVDEARDATKLLAAKRKERDDFKNGWPTAMVMRDRDKPRETFVLVRGRYQEHGEPVTMGVPEDLFPWPEGQPTNRLGLARWLTHPDHPLTARVVVNQYWQRYFGTGLVKTAEEFGAQGEWPSNKELLDWLATEFIRSGWNVKALQRLIVTSATYRQDSVVSPTALERDPEDRLLTRAPRFRLEAENIRDLALAVGGLLNRKIGGPSVYPYQPPGLWMQVAFEGTRDYVQSTGADTYRRGLYTYWRRSIPYASFTTFDAPTREVCTVRRPRTNTPLQALNLMNDPVYVEAARAFGQRILTQGGPALDDRILYACRVALGRRPTDAEKAVLRGTFEREFARYSRDRQAANQLIHVGATPPAVDLDPAALAAWTMVGSTLLNLDETITKG